MDPQRFGATECRPWYFFYSAPRSYFKPPSHNSALGLSWLACGGVIWCQKLNCLIAKHDGSFTPRSRRKISVCAGNEESRTQGLLSGLSRLTMSVLTSPTSPHCSASHRPPSS